MTITYKDVVINADLKMTVPKLITVCVTQNPPYAEMRNWCTENCQAPFYMLPSWYGKGCQFEDDEDALMFALRWT